MAKEPLIVPTESRYGSTAVTRTTSASEDIAENSSEDTSYRNTSNGDESEMRSLNQFEKIGYGLGHVYNDLCAGVWFSYTLLFLQKVMQLNSWLAGVMVMAGQIGDAVATPLIGLLVDKYGTKRQWHAAGTVMVTLSFPMIFSLCPWCDELPKWWESTYFITVIIIFQLGWAIVQITHLAMIPELSRSQVDRSDMTAIRYSASIISNVIVFIVTWLVLRDRTDSNNTLGPADVGRFREISLFLTGAGLSMTILFHLVLSVSQYEVRRKLAPPAQPRGQFDASYNVEAGPSTSASSSEDSVLTEDSLKPDETTSLTNPQVKALRFSLSKLLKSPVLYQNAFLYVFSRLFMTTALIYMPLWLDERAIPAAPSTPRQGAGDKVIETINAGAVEQLATVPLVSFLSSFLSSIFVKNSHRCLTHQTSYFFGSIVCIAACCSVYYVSPMGSSIYLLFGIAAMFGAGSSITMISSLCITADMIGSNSAYGGFIYSSVTFFDKFITGIVVASIEAIKCKNRSDCPQYYRNVLAFGCGAATVLGIVILLSLQVTRRYGRRRRARD